MLLLSLHFALVINECAAPCISCDIHSNVSSGPVALWGKHLGLWAHEMFPERKANKDYVLEKP